MILNGSCQEVSYPVCRVSYIGTNGRGALRTGGAEDEIKLLMLPVFGFDACLCEPLDRTGDELNLVQLVSLINALTIRTPCLHVPRTGSRGIQVRA